MNCAASSRRFAMRLVCFCLALVLVVGMLAAPLPALPSDASNTVEPELHVVESNASRVVLELNLPGYSAYEQVVDGATFTVLSVPGSGFTGEAGRPRLPVRGALVGIPPGAKTSLRILADDWRLDAVAYPPVPVPAAQVQIDPAGILPSPPGISLEPDPSTYTGSRLYPGEAARLAGEGNWRSQRLAAVEMYPLQYDPVARQLIFHRRLRVEVTFSSSFAVAENSSGGTVDEGLFEQVLQNSIVNYRPAKNWRTRNNPASPAVSREPMLEPSLPWFKVAVDADGIYRAGCADLASAGIDLASLDPRTLKVYEDGVEVAVDVAGQDDGRCDDADYLEFFGQAARTKYTDTNVYWLTYGGAMGRRMARRDGSGEGAPASTFTDTIHLEKDLVYRPYFPRVEGADHWFWGFLTGGGAASADYAFTVDSPASGPFSATLQATLFGYGGGHRTQILVNGSLVDDAIWSGSVERRATISFPQAYLASGANTVRLIELGPAGSYVFVNSFDISYASRFRAVSDTLRFRQPAGSWRFEVDGFSEANVEAFDISNPFDVVRIVSATVASPCPCALRFADGATAPREYLALTPGQRRAPLSITRDTPSNLRSSANGADYIAIAYGGFITSVQPLASFRAAQGMRVAVVDAQDVYDEFGDGSTDGQALRDFLAYAYRNWQAPAPYYVLLVGDGHFDFKNNLGVGEPNFIPPYLRMVDPWLGETASDSRLVAFEDATGNTLPQMAIGRLPAGSVADVDAMVSKVLRYEQNPPAGDWRTKIGFVADRAFDSSGVPDSASNFWTLSDNLAGNPAYIAAPFTAERIYYNACDSSVYPQCALPSAPYSSAGAVRDGIVAAIDEGRLVLNYVGHAGITEWGKDQIFRANQELPALANGGKTPLMVAMTCYDGFFHYPGLPSLAEVNVRLADRGALASWSATGLGVATGHDYLDRGFFAAIMQQGVLQLGPATMLAKANLWTNGGGANRDLIDTFSLLGDPASRLAVPDRPPVSGRLYLPVVLK